MTVKDLKKGEYFTIKPIKEPTENQVYIRGEYDRESKTYCCVKWNDCLGSGRSFKGTKEVYTDFIF